MNKWQTSYCKQYNKGKEPKSGDKKDNFDLLGQIKDTVTVTIPTGNDYPDIVKTYTIVDGESNVLFGTMNVATLLDNLYFWFDKDYQVETA